MIKRYGFQIIQIVFIIVLGWQMTNLLTAKKEEPISILEASLRAAKDNRQVLKKHFVIIEKNHLSVHI